MVIVPYKYRDMLLDIIDNRCPEVVTQYSRKGELSVNSNQREALLTALTEELCETGLDPDSEPNSRGHLIEDLIDIVTNA